MIGSGNFDMVNLQGTSETNLSSSKRGKRRTEKSDIPEDSYDSMTKSADRTGPRYPLMTEKLFGSLDKIEEAVGKLSDHPTNQQVSDSQMRNMARWVVVLSEAYGSQYDPEKLEKATKPFHDLAWYCGQFKDAYLVESQVKALFPDGKLPLAMQREIGKLKEERAEEFHEFFAKFKNKKLDKSLEFLRDPEPIDTDRPPAEIAREDRKKLGDEIGVLIDRIGETGLFHKDPERLHDGRKSLRNLYALMYVTGDVFNYDKSDVDALFHVFMHYGEPQDTHIAQAWLEEKGFEKESQVMRERMDEQQRNAMEEGTAFLDSGVLEHIRETASR